MQALILAGGAGSRLAASGVPEPKAFVPVQGVPQLLRQVAACRAVGFQEITCAVRVDLVGEANSLVAAHGARVISVDTPSSLHTLVAALVDLPRESVFCVLVDTIMLEADWRQAHADAAVRLREADAVVGVTPYVHDEAPLWADVSDDGWVRGFGRPGSRSCVTGGLYWFRPAALSVATMSTAEGIHRLRGFLSRLLECGLRVAAVTVPKIIDLDTAADLAQATTLLEESTG